jgi:hypothetical protein
VKGPTAAQIAGRIYRKLREQNYFAGVTLPGNLSTLNSGN